MAIPIVAAFNLQRKLDISGILSINIGKISELKLYPGFVVVFVVVVGTFPPFSFPKIFAFIVFACSLIEFDFFGFA